MPNITRGGDMGGVVRYLIGHGKEEPGKPGAHTEPHLVAGSPAVMAFWGADELHPNQAGAIAAELDHPRRVFGTSVTVPKKDAEGHVVGRRDAHVWHCSLSLRPDEAALSDERWAHIAEDFVAGMGFDDGQAAACRWAAVHHGLSKAGNDHIHIVVGLVREDGSKARVNRDQPRAQRLAGELERKYGLQVLESRESGHTSRGYTPRDQERDEAGRDWAPAMGTERTDRGRLERTVRACATAAGTEADFVRLLRFHGLRVKPRFAAGRGDRIGGYAVALPPAKGKAPVWFSGGRLARDLTLPGIRASAGWADTPAESTAAVAEWTAAGRQQPDVGTTQLPTRDPEQWRRASQELGALRDRLRAVGPGDRAEWARIAGDAAGVLAAWSLEKQTTSQRPFPDPGRWRPPPRRWDAPRSCQRGRRGPPSVSAPRQPRARRSCSRPRRNRPTARWGGWSCCARWPTWPKRCTTRTRRAGISSALSRSSGPSAANWKRSTRDSRATPRARGRHSTPTRCAPPRRRAAGSCPSGPARHRFRARPPSRRPSRRSPDRRIATAIPAATAALSAERDGRLSRTA